MTAVSFSLHDLSALKVDVISIIKTVRPSYVAVIILVCNGVVIVHCTLQKNVIKFTCKMLETSRD